MDSLQSPPAKRRALAALDANALSSPRHPNQLGGTQDKLISVKSDLDASLNTGNNTPGGRKRALNADGLVDAGQVMAPATESYPKRTCVEAPGHHTNERMDTDDTKQDGPARTEEVDEDEDMDTTRSPASHDSPDASSLFDNSTNDASWATAATDPHPQANLFLAPPARRLMTREQAREKAEILRLRLGLASYKLRTGQTTVPLADLQLKPLPRTAKQQQQSPPEPSPQHQSRPTSSREQPVVTSATIQSNTEDDSSSIHVETEAEQAHTLPALTSPAKRSLMATAAAVAAVTTPQRARHLVLAEEKLTSSALRGGAASGLLSLARGGDESDDE